MINIRSTKQAFTLFEILAVLMLVGVLAAFVLPRVTKYLRQAGQAEVKLKFATIKEGLSDYKFTFGVYPTSREGLRALVTNPRPNVEVFRRNADKWPIVKEKDITDKAGNELLYHCPPERYKDKYRYYEILYLGPTQSETDAEALDDGE